MANFPAIYKEKVYTGAEPYFDNMRQTRPMAILLHTHKGYKSYQANLDCRFSAEEWRAKYIAEGFRDPKSGEVFDPHDLYSAQVRELGEAFTSRLIPTEGSLAWLYDQVEEICALAAA